MQTGMANSVEPLKEQSDLCLNTLFALRPKQMCLVSGNTTEPTFLGPTVKCFGTSENFSSIFRVF